MLSFASDVVPRGHLINAFAALASKPGSVAACGICGVEVFRSVGGYDEGYRPPSIEDIELGYRLRRAGHRIALDPSWQVKHLKQWAWHDLVFTDIGRRTIP